MTDGMMFSPDGTSFDPDAMAAAAIAKRQQPYKLLKIADVLAMEDPEHLVESMIPKTGMTILYGPSGTFKSFIALDLALCVASGFPFFGKAVQQAPVVYIAGEGVAGMKLRIQAWQLAHGGADPTDHFHLLPNAVNLLDTDENARVIGALEGVKAELGQQCGLLIVDTLARALVGGDENSAKDVGLLIDNTDQIVRPLASLIVHHTGKDGAAERGSSALRGAADSMLRTERTDKLKVKLKCAKSKDAAEFDDMAFVMVPTGPSVSLQIDLTPATEEPDLKHLVLAYIARQDGLVHKSDVKRALGRRQADVYEAINTLEFEEKIEAVKHGQKVFHRACPAARDKPGHTGTNADPGQPGTPDGAVSGRRPLKGTRPDTVPEPHPFDVDNSLSGTNVGEGFASALADVDAAVDGTGW